MGRDVNTNDQDDPLNYVSFDSYSRGVSMPPLPLGALTAKWNRAHPEARVLAQGVSAAPNVTPITPDNCGTTRVFAALQLLGGGMEIIVGGGALLAPEPTGITKVIGVVAVVHGVDTLQSAFRSIVTCDRTATFTQSGAAAVAEGLGASPETAETIGVVTDIGVGAGSTFALGALSRVAAGPAQLVHLTNANSAAAIRGSQTLGLGRSTIYAGPESLANAKGWSIVWKTARPASQMTEVILLPSEAGKSFLMVNRIGPFSAWQRLHGTVFSAGTGSFNLTTGAFTRSGTAVNQIGIYLFDSVVMASMRAAPVLGPPPNRSVQPPLRSQE